MKLEENPTQTDAVIAERNIKTMLNSYGIRFVQVRLKYPTSTEIHEEFPGLPILDALWRVRERQGVTREMKTIVCGTFDPIYISADEIQKTVSPDVSVDNFIHALRRYSYCGCRDCQADADRLASSRG